MKLMIDDVLFTSNKVEYAGHSIPYIREIYSSLSPLRLDMPTPSLWLLVRGVRPEIQSIWLEG